MWDKPLDAAAMALFSSAHTVKAQLAEQSDIKAEPVLSVPWPAGQARQDTEAGAAWYLEAGQEVQTAAPTATYLPAGHSVQPVPLSQLSPVLQARQSRQEVEAGSGW